MGKAGRKEHGCACSPPTLQETHRERARERRAEFAANMRIVRMADARYHVVSMPGLDGEPVQAWPGPWETEAAARLFMDDLLDACAEGSPRDACCSDGIFEHFHLAGRILEITESHQGDNRGLANALAHELSKPAATEVPDGEIIF